jgi:hypothetical protein
VAVALGSCSRGGGGILSRVGGRGVCVVIARVTWDCDDSSGAAVCRGWQSGRCACWWWVQWAMWRVEGEGEEELVVEVRGREALFTRPALPCPTLGPGPDPDLDRDPGYTWLWPPVRAERRAKGKRERAVKVCGELNHRAGAGSGLALAWRCFGTGPALQHGSVNRTGV